MSVALENAGPHFTLKRFRKLFFACAGYPNNFILLYIIYRSIRYLEIADFLTAAAMIPYGIVNAYQLYLAVTPSLVKKQYKIESMFYIVFFSSCEISILIWHLLNYAKGSGLPISFYLLSIHYFLAWSMYYTYGVTTFYDQSNVKCKTGMTIPDGKLKTIDGKTILLSSVLKKSNLLLFFRSWCTYCIGHVNELINLQDEFEQKGVSVFLISLLPPEDLSKFAKSVSEKDMRNVYFLSDESKEYTKFLGILGKENVSYAVETMPGTIRSNDDTYPALLIIDENRKVHYSVLPTLEWSRPSKEETFDKLDWQISISKLEASLKSQLSELEKIKTNTVESANMNALGEIASSIVVEVEKPISEMNTYANQITSTIEKPSFSKEDLEKVNQNLNSSITKVSSIVTVFKKLSTAEENEKKDINVKEFINDCLLFCNEKLEHEGIKIKIKNIEDNISISSNPVKISQIFLNIIDNAINAISSFKDKWIEIEVASDNRNTTIHITDCGLGIKKQDREKIFQPFYKSNAKTGNLSFGLSLSKNFLNSQKGDIIIDPSCKNTRFCIIFPKEA